MPVSTILDSFSAVTPPTSAEIKQLISSSSTNSRREYVEVNNYDDLLENYSITTENIKIALDNVKSLRESIDSYSNEEILKTEEFVITEINWSGDATGKTNAIEPIIKIDSSEDTLNKGFKTTLFEDGMGLRSQLSEIVERYYNTDSAPNNINEIVTEYENDFTGLQSVTDIFTLLTYHNENINDTLNNVTDAINVIDGLNMELIPESISDFYLDTIVEKVSGTNTGKVSSTISELDKILTAIDNINKKNAGTSFLFRVTSRLHNVLLAASNILSSNENLLYGFLLEEFSDDKDMFEKLFTEDEVISSSAQKDITKKLTSKWEDKFREYSKFDKDRTDDEKYADLRIKSSNQNTIVLDRGASYTKKDTTYYLDTDSADEKQYKDTLSSIGELFDSFRTTEERQIVSVMMRIMLSSSNRKTLVVSNKGYAYTEPAKNSIYKADIYVREADEGVGKEATSVIEIELSPISELVDNFDTVFLDGKNIQETFIDGPGSINTGVKDEQIRSIQEDFFGGENALDFFANDCVKHFIPIQLHIKELNSIATRIEKLKELLQTVDEIDAESLSVTFDKDFSGLLRNGDINIALAVKEYYDILQESNNPLIQNRFSPINDQEKTALESLFSEQNLIQGNIDEQIKIFSLGLTRESIGEIYAPKKISVVITKIDTLYPEIVFEPHKIDIDILNFPVLNSYNFNTTQTSSVTTLNEIGTAISSASTKYTSFKDFVQDGMHFLNLDEITAGSAINSIEPKTFDEIIASDDDATATEIKLLNAAKSYVLGIYIRSLIGTEFKGSDLDERYDDVWYDENAVENFEKIYDLPDPETELSKRFKNIMLYNSTILNNQKIIDDVLSLHDIMYTYHAMLNITTDFAYNEEDYPDYDPTKTLQNLEFEVSSSFESDIQLTVEQVIKGEEIE